jgi:hypothetical protein
MPKSFKTNRFRKDFKCDREEGISGEDGDSFPVFHVTRWHAATEIVVVHAGKIIVNERIGMNAFDCASRRECVREVSIAGFGGSKAENRAKALPTGEEAVAHRLMHGGGSSPGRREVAVERPVDDLTALFQIGS